MIIWIIATFCCSLIGYLFDWSSWECFMATGIFAIFMILNSIIDYWNLYLKIIRYR
jgi:TM2 domain-containing membrane protein YozV